MTRPAIIEPGLSRVQAGTLYNIVQLDATPEHHVPEWRAELTDDSRTVIAWTEFKEDEATEQGTWLVYWKDIRNRHYLWDVAWLGRSAREYLTNAASRALREGGWSRQMAAKIVMHPHDHPFIKGSKHPQGDWYHNDVIPVGAATNMIQVTAFAKVFFCSPAKITKFLKRIGVPLIKMPNNRNHFSLLILELALLKESGVANTWQEAMAILKDAQTVYKAAAKSKALDRLRRLASDLRPQSEMLKRATSEQRPMQKHK
jgi:hypothetical protein